jgi:hypothetical protein
MIGDYLVAKSAAFMMKTPAQLAFFFNSAGNDLRMTQPLLI